MKLRELQRHLKEHGCIIRRDTGPHTVWENTSNGKTTVVARHTEISNIMAKKICVKDLEIPEP